MLTLLNPVAPHITEEIWQAIGESGYVYAQSWPEFEEEKTIESTIEIALQINGKVRGTMHIGKDEPKEEILARAKEMLKERLTGTVAKEVYVPGRLVNIVLK